MVTIQQRRKANSQAEKLSREFDNITRTAEKILSLIYKDPYFHEFCDADARKRYYYAKRGAISTLKYMEGSTP